MANSKSKGAKRPPQQGSSREQAPKDPAGKTQQRPSGKPIARSSVAQAAQVDEQPHAADHRRHRDPVDHRCDRVRARPEQAGDRGAGRGLRSVDEVGRHRAGRRGPVSAARTAADNAVTIDVYEDPMCPACAQFEEQFGQQINQAVDDGKLILNVHMLNFLNPQSASGDYSTRAIAATLCVAQHSGSQPGVYLTFKEKLYAPGTQPAEGGSGDLSNQQLADLATAAGASQAAADCITSGSEVPAAAAAAQASQDGLSAAIRSRCRTPSVLKDGAGHRAARGLADAASSARSDGLIPWPGRWGCGAAGSAQHWQCWGQGFESPQLHPTNMGRRRPPERCSRRSRSDPALRAGVVILRGRPEWVSRRDRPLLSHVVADNSDDVELRMRRVIGRGISRRSGRVGVTRGVGRAVSGRRVGVKGGNRVPVLLVGRFGRRGQSGILIVCDGGAVRLADNSEPTIRVP